MSEGKRGFRQDINALRALGVALVVLFHFKVPGFSGGFAGVDVFFVVSGYLMTSIIVSAQERGRFSYVTFLTARILRIWPALVVLTATLILAAMLWLPPVDLRLVAKYGAYSLMFLSNHMYAGQSGYFAPASEQNLFLHTWSLSLEWQFYMLFPLLLILGRHTFGRQGAIVVLGLVLFGSLAWCLAEPSDALRFFGLPSRAWELAIGGIAYWVGRSRPPMLERPHVRSVLGYGGMLLILISVAMINPYRPWPLPWAALPVLGAAIFIVARHEGNRLVHSRAVQSLGLWSYSVYLWHWPVVATLHLLHWSDVAWCVALGLPLSVLLGWASYRFVEEPTRRGFKARVRLGSAATVGSWVVVLSVAAVIVKLGGLPQRNPDLAASLESLAKAEQDWTFPDECANWRSREHFVVCSINEHLTQGPRWLVVGDSHAQHYYPYFKTHSTHRVDFLTSGGCLPAPGLNRTSPGFFCPEFVEAIRNAVASGAYERVVVAAAWAGYFDPIGKYCNWEEDHCTSVIHDSSSVRPIFDKLESLWSEFRRRGTEVSVVLPEPRGEPDVSLPRELARRRFLGLNETDLVSIPIDRHRADVSAVRSGLLRVTQAVGASIVDPEEQLCHDERCWFIDQQGAPIVRDGHHFRATWVARELRFLDQLGEGGGVQLKPHQPVCAR